MQCAACHRSISRDESARCWTCHSAVICTTCCARHARRYTDHLTAWAYTPDTPVLETNLDRR